MTLYIILGVTLVALIVLVTIFFIQKRKAKKAAEAMGDQSIAPGGDDVSVLIHDAEAKLAAAKMENPKVGSLPVYIVMGEPGTTKTSVMLHCGLEPELIAGQVYQAGNVAPTRSANFWFSRRSLFVETGGALSGDLGKWRTAVKRLQPRSSVRKGEQAGRAAVVCFDCENFTKPGAADIVTNSARTLRARLGEISQAMGINLPVYALFTKIDRLPFFTEFVRNLNTEESTQVLGVTLPMMYRRSEGVYAEEETARLTGNFERLFRSVADARPEFLAREGDASKLPPAYEFPREFRKIRPVVVQFLVDLCRPSQLTVGPFLRGFYFTGVRPVIVNEGAPVSPAAAPQQQGFAPPAGATGIFSRSAPMQAAAAPQQQAAPAPGPGSRKVPQWLFLSHLFNDVLLADKVAMGASGSSIKTSSARRWLMISAASLCFLLTTFFTISFFRNNSLENRVRDAAHGIASAESVGGDLASLDSLRRLETLRQALEQLVIYRREGAPLFYRWGLYIGNDLYVVARRIYFDRFKKLLLTQIQGGILQDMRSIPPAPVPEHPYSPTYEELKAYLITTNHHEKSTKMFLTPVLTRWWTNRHDVDSERTQLAQKQFDFYAEELKEENPFSTDNDGLAIERTRAYLKQFAGMERVYNTMLGKADEAGTAINFNRQYPGSAQYVRDDYDVRGAFSKGGWNYMKAAFGNLDQFFSGEAWVLGDQSGPVFDRAQLAKDLRARYYSDFINQWTTYLKSAVVVRYGGLRDAANKLKSHSGNQAPLLELSALASQHTAVDEPTVARIFQPVQSVTPPENVDHYVAPSNQNYINALGQLQSAIDAIADQPPNDDRANATLAVARQAEGTVTQIAQPFRVDSPIQGTVQTLLMQPITYAEAYLKGVGAAELNNKGGAMCKQINPILSKYPFNPSSQTDATIPDVGAVFKPKDGTMWKFVEGDLAKFVTKQGSQYVGVPSPGVTIQPGFLGWLNRAAAFSDAAFKDGAQDPHFNYTIKPLFTPDLESVKLTADGQSATFTAASAAAKAMVWPGSPQGEQSAVTFPGGKGFDLPPYPGLWGMFKWVADADSKVGTVVTMTIRSGRSQQAVTYPGTTTPVTVKFDITANPPIFDKGYFSTLNCVSNVAR